MLCLYSIPLLGLASWRQADANLYKRATLPRRQAGKGVYRWLAARWRVCGSHDMAGLKLHCGRHALGTLAGMA
jgi:hypothetical protein